MPVADSEASKADAAGAQAPARPPAARERDANSARGSEKRAVAAGKINAANIDVVLQERSTEDVAPEQTKGEEDDIADPPGRNKEAGTTILNHHHYHYITQYFAAQVGAVIGSSSGDTSVASGDRAAEAATAAEAGDWDPTRRVFASCKSPFDLSVLVSCAVLEGLPRNRMLQDAERLAEGLVPRSGGSARSEADVFDTGRSVDALFKRIDVETFNGSSPLWPDRESELMRFRRPHAAASVLWHAWNNLTGVRGWRAALIDWLRSLVEGGDDAVRLAVGRAVGVLAVRDYDGAFRNFLRPWFEASIFEPLTALDMALMTLHLARPMAQPTLADLLTRWANGEEQANGIYAAARIASGACFFSSARPRCLDALEALIRTKERLAFEEARRAYNRIFDLCAQLASGEPTIVKAIDETVASLQCLFELAEMGKDEVAARLAASIFLELTRRRTRGQDGIMRHVFDEILAAPVDMAPLAGALDAAWQLLADLGSEAVRAMVYRASATTRPPLALRRFVETLWRTGGRVSRRRLERNLPRYETRLARQRDYDREWISNLCDAHST